jgi:alkylated DNA repair protein (DNA oxidative demethylase)
VRSTKIIPSEKNSPPAPPVGFRLYPEALTEMDQRALLADIQHVMLSAPLFQPRVQMTNCGPLGWVSDKDFGYRYQPTHLDTGQPWPPMPEKLIELWRDFAECDGLPDACLINYYPTGAKMGSHCDRDEDEHRAPVLSVSLGNDAIFHVGGLKRSDPKSRVVLRSGDVCVLGGAARFAFHGIDRILPGTSDLVPGGGRINLTLRRVTRFG